jgi:hypothetical protein
MIFSGTAGRFKELLMSCGIPNNMQVSCPQQISIQATSKSLLTISHIAVTYLIQDVWSSDGDECGFSLYLFDMTDKNIFAHFHDILANGASNYLISSFWSICDILRLNGPHQTHFRGFSFFP